jgi:Icc-related predicted phosphoesterase
MATDKEVVRLAAVSDIHYGKTSGGKLQSLFEQINDSADILLICGDLTDYGLPEEAQLVVKDLSGVKIPIIAVLGNHDYESGQEEDVKHILTEAGITLLDGDSCEFHGVGFAGVKGFGGGFGRGTLGFWGEPAIKSFVQEAINETLKLESALARLRTEQRIGVLHYAPIPTTIEGEPLEIYPWLGTSRLEEPFNRYPVSAIFHGHAHKGQPEGKTTAGIPVYNVSLTLLAETFPDHPPFRLLEIPVTRVENESIAG